MEKRKRKHRGLGLIVSLLLAALVFVMLVIFTGTVNRGKDQVKVVVAVRDIPANTIIKEEAGNQYFMTMSVDEELAYKGTYASLKEVFSEGDIFLTDNLNAKEILSKDRISANNPLLEGFEDPVSMGIKVGSFEYAAGGILRRGDVVDLCTTNEVGEEEGLRVYILQAFNHSGERIDSENTTDVAVAFNILLERSEYARVVSILTANKSFDLVKVSDID